MNIEYGAMDRRGFLTAAAGLAAAGVVGGGSRGAAGQVASGGSPVRWGPRQVRKALKFGMIGEGGSIAEKFRIAREAGFEGIEMDSPNDLDRAEVLAAREASGLTIAGVVNSVHWGKPLSHPDAAVRMEGRHGLERAILDCRAYGGTTVLLVPAVVNAEVSYGEAWERSMREIRAVLPMAQDVGVQIALENVWNSFLLSPLEAARYVDELRATPGVRESTECADGISRPTVGWYFDVGNVWAYGWPGHWLGALGSGRIARLDIKGYSRAKADKEGKWAGFGVEIGDGDVPWDSVRDWLTTTGWWGWATAEVGGGDLARLKDIAARMDRVLGIES